MASSRRMQVAQQILKTLKDMVFDPADGDNCKRIEAENIILRKVATLEKDYNAGQTMLNTPNIVVSLPFREPFNASAGENNHDEYVYRFLIQIQDSDNSEQTDNYDTYWLWQEQIQLAFQFACNEQFPDVDTYRILCNTVAVGVVDERYWIKEEEFRSGVELAVRVWLTRDSGP